MTTLPSYYHSSYIRPDRTSRLIYAPMQRCRSCLAFAARLVTLRRRAGRDDQPTHPPRLAADLTTVCLSGIKVK